MRRLSQLLLNQTWVNKSKTACTDSLQIPKLTQKNIGILQKRKANAISCLLKAYVAHNGSPKDGYIPKEKAAQSVPVNLNWISISFNGQDLSRYWSFLVWSRLPGSNVEVKNSHLPTTANISFNMICNAKAQPMKSKKDLTRIFFSPFFSSTSSWKNC